VRFLLFNGGVHGFQLTLRINHAQLDGMPFSALLEDLAAAHQSSDDTVDWPGFSNFIYNAREVNKTGTFPFFRSTLAGASMTQIVRATAILPQISR
jgi:hypothetical protein